MHTNKPYDKGSLLLLSYSPFQKMLPAIAQSSDLGVFDTLLSLASPTLSSTHHKIPNMTLHFHCFATTPGYHCLFPSVTALLPWPGSHSCSPLWSTLQMLTRVFFLKHKSDCVILLLKIFHRLPTECVKSKLLYLIHETDINWPLPVSLIPSFL